MTDVILRKEETQIQYTKGRSCDNGSRNGTTATPSQGIPGMSIKPPDTRKRQEEFSPKNLRGNMTPTLL